MSAALLATALRAAGVPCDVESWDGLAVIRLETGPSCLGDDHLRRRILALAREHGFTHAAVELAAADDRAAVRRD